MAKNTIRKRALAGETVLGSMVFEFFVPGMPQILSRAGAEYAIYDMEHAGLGLETLKMLVAASRGTGVLPMVRVPRGEYHFIARALDVGAQGMMVPMVESVDQAATLPSPPDIRGRDGAARPSALRMTTTQPGDPAGKMKEADGATSSSPRSRPSEGWRRWMRSPPSKASMPLARPFRHDQLPRHPRPVRPVRTIWRP